MTATDLYMYLTTLSIVVVSFFACWALYYLVRILKRIDQFLDTIQDSYENAHKGFESFINRFLSVRDSIQMLAQGIQAASSMYHKIKKQPKRKKPSTDLEDITEE